MTHNEMRDAIEIFDKSIANIICGCSPEPFVPTPVFSPEFWVHKVSREGFFS